MKFFRTYRWIFYGIVCVLCGAVIGAIIYITKIVSSMRPIEELKMEEMVNPNISQEAMEVMEGYWTIALFGVDSRDGDLGKDTLADVQIICNIDRKTGEIRLLSVYRDTYLQVDDKGKYSKINDAYFFGGPPQALSALSNNLDMSFDDCVAFNWKAVAEAINILGGIDIEITDDEFKQINGYITETVKSTGIGSFHLKKAGMNHLDGVQAVAYSRLRKLDTDFRRTERQRTVIAKALEKAKKADFAVLNNIMVTVLPQIKSTITLDDLIPMAKNISRYHIGESAGFPFDKKDQIVYGKDCVLPMTLESNVVKLHEFLFDDLSYKPSKKVKEISEKIQSDGGNKGRKSEKQETGEWKSKGETQVTLPETSESAPAESSFGESLPAAETSPVGPGFQPVKPKESSGAESVSGSSGAQSGTAGETGSSGSVGSPGGTESSGSTGSPGGGGSSETAGSPGGGGSSETVGSPGGTGSTGSAGSTGGTGSTGSAGSTGGTGSTGSAGSPGSGGNQPPRETPETAPQTGSGGSGPGLSGNGESAPAAARPTPPETQGGPGVD